MPNTPIRLLDSEGYEERAVAELEKAELERDVVKAQLAIARAQAYATLALTKATLEASPDFEYEDDESDEEEVDEEDDEDEEDEEEEDDEHDRPSYR